MMDVFSLTSGVFLVGVANIHIIMPCPNKHMQSAGMASLECVQLAAANNTTTRAATIDPEPKQCLALAGNLRCSGSLHAGPPCLSWGRSQDETVTVEEATDGQSATISPDEVRPDLTVSRATDYPSSSLPTAFHSSARVTGARRSAASPELQQAPAGRSCDARQQALLRQPEGYGEGDAAEVGGALAIATVACTDATPLHCNALVGGRLPRLLQRAAGTHHS
jgi:hypothetical protein